MRAATETLDVLQTFCDDKYGDESPGFGKLRNALEEVGNVVSVLLNEKRKLEPDEATEEAGEEPEPEAEPEAAAEEEIGAAPQRVARARPSKSMAAEPVDREDAMARVQACARFLQADNPSSPVAYLLQAALRLGEMREQGSGAAWDFLVPPATEKRQNLKRLAAEENWSELLSAAIDAAGEPCGRAWLDVHRYIWRASTEAGSEAIATSVVSTLQALLKDLPEVPTWTLSDDTPTANPETQRWLEETVIPKPPEPEPAQPEPEPMAYIPVPEPEREAGEEAPPDVFEEARELASRGRLAQAVQLLMREAAQQPSGRSRFLRRLQMAQLCVSAGQGKVAFPVLEELVREIDQRQLEAWEASDMIAPPLALLLRCLDASENGNNVRDAVFARLCRVDPTAAMEVSR